MALRRIARVARDPSVNTPFVASQLDEWSPIVRAAAARALGAYGTEAAEFTPELTRALDDVDSRVRAAAAFAIGEIGPAAHGAFTRGAFTRGAFTRGAFTRGAFARVVELLEDTSRIARRDAAIALGELGPRAPGSAVDALLARATDEDPMVRRHVIAALGRMAAPRPDVIAALRGVLADEALEPVARVALARLGVE